MPKMKLEILADQAIDGDEEVLDYLRLQETEVNCSDNSVITWETLCGNHQSSTHVFVVSEKLGLLTL